METEDSRSQATERRRHPRVQLPLLVELQHPAIGRKRCTARDVSEGGLFVEVDEHPITVGAKLKLTLLNPNQVDQQPTPTVDMEVKRVEEHGIGLAFVNRTSRHLWESVQRLRSELEVGRDYFQIYLAALAMNEDGRLLLLQEHGRWTFPGHYLVVGENWREALAANLAQRFHLKTTHIQRIYDMSSSARDDLPEAAALKILVLVSVDDSDFALPEDTKQQNLRWIDRRRDIEEITFADELERGLAIEALDWYQA